MTWIDIAVVVTICACAAFGYWRGILRTAIGIAGLLGGILLASALHQRLAQLIWPRGGTWSFIASYAIILLAALAITAIVAALVARTVYQTPLGIVDRLLGLVVGVLIALGVWVLIITIVLLILPGGEEIIADSPIAALIVRWLADIQGLPATTSEPAQIV